MLEANEHLTLAGKCWRRKGLEQQPNRRRLVPHDSSQSTSSAVCPLVIDADHSIPNGLFSEGPENLNILVERDEECRQHVFDGLRQSLCDMEKS